MALALRPSQWNRHLARSCRVTVYIQDYTQVYLHIYIHIYVQSAHNFDTFYATKLKFGMIFTQTQTLGFMVELPLGLALGRGQGSECITGHYEHMQNANRIISLVSLLALESEKSGIMITDEILCIEIRIWKLDHARGGAVGWGQRK